MSEIVIKPQAPLKKRIALGALTLVIGLGLTIFVTHSVSSVDLTGQPDAVKTMFGLFPLVFATAVVFGTVNNILGYSENTAEESECQTIDDHEVDYWSAYGDRLKRAYTAKFGGENKGFNQEVDMRVAIMLANGRGFTRAIAKDWLKRMHTFTESK